MARLAAEYGMSDEAVSGMCRGNEYVSGRRVSAVPCALIPCHDSLFAVWFGAWNDEGSARMLPRLACDCLCNPVLCTLLALSGPLSLQGSWTKPTTTYDPTSPRASPGAP
jgi:hypothetical protein